MLVCETTIASGGWAGGKDSGDEDWQGLAADAVAAALAVSPYGGLAARSFDLEAAVRLSDDAEVRTLNRQFRGKDKPTNILSFPLLEAAHLEALANTDDGEALLGDLVLAGETCVREAGEKGWGLGAYVQHLIVHGTLHLLGYDHETSEAAADAMESLEREACVRLGLDDPYAE
ncbi:MAG: rRNA maturation RNase YbeY [Polymorphobacter sp.]|uniref:rRNA maturation RNase YbeY n=1 Tax=Polymorphobacter sp. TaxID=1909290 RepID=UPI003A83B604